MGINFLTKIKDGDKGEGSVFADSEDAIVALEYGKISLHAKIKVKDKTFFNLFISNPPHILLIFITDSSILYISSLLLKLSIFNKMNNG